jgi:hypothetical protein
MKAQIAEVRVVGGGTVKVSRRKTLSGKTVDKAKVEQVLKQLSKGHLRSHFVAIDGTTGRLIDVRKPVSRSGAKTSRRVGNKKVRRAAAALARKAYGHRKTKRKSSKKRTSKKRSSKKRASKNRTSKNRRYTRRRRSSRRTSRRRR